jgi:hypothetical protein
MKKPVAISIIRPAIVSVIILFLLWPAQRALAGSIVGWGSPSRDKLTTGSRNSCQLKGGI